MKTVLFDRFMLKTPRFDIGEYDGKCECDDECFMVLQDVTLLSYLQDPPSLGKGN